MSDVRNRLHGDAAELRAMMHRFLIEYTRIASGIALPVSNEEKDVLARTLRWLADNT